MTIQQAIETAIWGGWIVTKDSFHKEGNYNYAAVLLKPLFWQALGKAMGWRVIDLGLRQSGGIYWLDEWHRFIDHLAEGKSAESWFEGLSSP